jgi:hypothetical protein
VIYTIAPSPVASHANLVWVGTDDGLIHVTPDAGKTWSNVTPPELTPWSKVVMMQASHFDANEAYAAIDRHRLADNEPHIYRTRDGGKTWQKITDGLAPGVYVQTVKDDTKRKGLLFAGTETSVYVSFDDGDHWQSLQLNLPAVSMRDLAIHGDDLLVATHGRGFYVLDDITQLRQLTPEVAGAEAHLFKPAEVLRMHAGTDNASPMPRDEALADNPPTGALIDYYLKDAASGAVTIEILDGQGKLARKYSSDDKAPVVDPKRINVPASWIPKVPQLSTAAGVHRWIWDLHYSPPRSDGRGGEYAFFFRGSGVAALPGTYTVKLTVGGKSYTQPLTVRMDPRIKTPLADLQKQFRLGTEIGQKQIEISETRRQVTNLREQIKKLREPASGNAAPNQAIDEALASLDKKAEGVEGVPPAPTPTAGVPEAPRESADLIYLSSNFATLGAAVNSGDSAPTVEATKAVAAAENTLAGVMAKWKELVAKDLPAANAKLKSAGMSEITIPAAH